MKKPTKCRDEDCEILTTAHHVVYMYMYTYVFLPKTLVSSVTVILANILHTLESYFSSKQICSVFLCFFFPTEFPFSFEGGFGSDHVLIIPTASPSPRCLVMFPHHFLTVFQCL